MRVLILSVSAGYGHHATAKAVGDMLKAKGCDVTTTDIYEYINRGLHDMIEKGYSISTKFVPDIYRSVYSLLEKKEKPSSKANLLSIVNMLGAIKFEKHLDESNPDVIICTHIFAAQLISELKSSGRLKTPLIGIVTDYTIHPYWEDAPDIDYIITANEFLTYRALKRGINPDAIKPLGIPIHPKFADSIGKTQARRTLSLNDGMNTILVMGGSMGYGDMLNIVSRIEGLKMEFQVLAVCGNSKRAFNSITDYKNNVSGTENLHIYGFTDKIDLMMEAADCIVTKPGGLTISEALSKCLPMILTNPIPGQEERNIEFLLNYGSAMHATKTFTVDEAVYYMFHDEDRLLSMRQSMEKLRKPTATNDVCDFAIGLAK